MREWILKAAITCGMVVAVFRAVPAGDALRSLGGAAPGVVLAALPLLIAMRALASLRMKRLTDLQGMSIGTLEILQISLASSFYGFLLPGSLSGGLVRWYRITRHGTTAPRALAAILVDRWAHTVVLAGAGALLFAAGATPASLAPAGVVLTAVFAGLVAIAALGLGPPARWPLAVRLRTGESRWLPRFARGRVRDLFAALYQYRAPSRPIWGAVLSLSVATQVVGIAAFALLARALDLPLGLADLGWIRACMVFAVILPISVAGVGVREGILVVLLQPFGVDGADAVALGLLDFATFVATVSVGGAWELWARRAPRNG